MEEDYTNLDYGEKIIQFGNWIVTNEVIYWGGETNNYFHILTSKLSAKYFDNEMNKYDWPIHLASKQWLSEEDLNHFNLAFIFALDYFDKLNKNPNIKIYKTLELQRYIIEERNNPSFKWE